MRYSKFLWSLWTFALCLWIPTDILAQRGDPGFRAEGASIDTCMTSISYALRSVDTLVNQGGISTIHFRLNSNGKKVDRIEVAVHYGTGFDYDLALTSGYPKPWGSNNWTFSHDPSGHAINAVVICDTATAINDSLFGLRFDVGCIPWNQKDSAMFIGDCTNDTNAVHSTTYGNIGPGTRTNRWVSNEEQAGVADLVPDTTSTGQAFMVPHTYSTNISADSGFEVRIAYRDDKITFDSLQRTGTDTQGKQVYSDTVQMAGADTLVFWCDEAIHSGGVVHTLFNLWFTNNMPDNYDTTMVKSSGVKLYNCAGLNDVTLGIIDNATLLTRFMATVSAQSVSTLKNAYGVSDIKVLNNFAIELLPVPAAKVATVSIDTVTWIGKIKYNQVISNWTDSSFWENRRDTTIDTTSQYLFREHPGNDSRPIPVITSPFTMFGLKYQAVNVGTAQMDMFAQQNSSHPKYRKDCVFTAHEDTSVVIYGAGSPTDISLTDGTITVYTGGGGGGSCPFVYTWTGSDYMREDVILTECEKRPEGTAVTDYLPLAFEPALIDGAYRLRIHEQEAEKTFLDQLELWVVDHERGYQASVDLEGNLIFGQERLRPAKAVDGEGNDILQLLLAADGANFERTEAGSLLATFEAARPGLTHALAADDSTGQEGGDTKNPCKVWAGPQGVEGLKPAEVKLEIEDTRGQWHDVPRGPLRLPGVRIRPVLNLSEYDLGQTFRIRYSWEGPFEIDELALIVQAPVKYAAKHIRPANAAHSGGRPVRGLLDRADDLSAELVTGEFVDLEFPAKPIPDGQERSFVLAARGYYLTWYGHKDAGRPLAFGLNGNYPNPFNPSTTIRYSLAADANVTLEVFNILGQKVRTLVDGRSLTAGAYEDFWDGNNEQGEPVGSGAYLYRLTAGDLTDTRRMILLK